MASSSLQAHHSLAGVYDMKAEKELSGTVEKVQFSNPHGSLSVGVKNPDGSTSNAQAIPRSAQSGRSSFRRRDFKRGGCASRPNS